MKIRNALLVSLVIFSSPAAWSANVPVPVATDSRIKTFVYSENDVFNIVAHFGYQSNIEFPENETIDTISVGNRMGWQIVTAGRRLFIRPTLSSARTNMTVITSKRAYQFDLTAVTAVYSPNEELAYVIRFYYPDEDKNLAQAPYNDDTPPAGFEASLSSHGEAAPAQEGGNYNYSYTGDESLAPLKVYDDGVSTYFKFGSSVEAPSIVSVGPDKRESSVSMHKQGDYWVADAVSSQFVVRQGNSSVCIFNEKYAQR